MARTDWYRRTTWTDQDREDFNARLQRSRGDSNKAQYLCIQAGSLAKAGLHEPAIELLDRFFAEFPGQQTTLSLAYGLRAASRAERGQIDAAIEDYRAALETERRFPHTRTYAWLAFGDLVLAHERTELYDEVARVVKEFRERDADEEDDDEEPLRFPAIEYRYFTLQALLADARGERKNAREFARQALFEAGKDNTGLRFHPHVGLVGKDRGPFEQRVKKLAGK